MKSHFSTSQLLTIGSAAILLAQAAPVFAQGWPTPVSLLPERATALDKRFQPAIDFDTDVCFNVPAVDAAGTISPAASTYATRPPASYRSASYRTQSNVYARSRCNNGLRGRGQHVSYPGERDDERSSVTTVFKYRG